MDTQAELAESDLAAKKTLSQELSGEAINDVSQTCFSNAYVSVALSNASYTLASAAARANGSANETDGTEGNGKG
jgi:hypothetical protein